MSLTIKARVKSFYANFDYKKAYITAKTASAIINDNKIIEDKQMLIKLEYELDGTEQSWETFGLLSKERNLAFTVKSEHEDTQSNGYNVKQFTVLDIQCS